MTEPCGIRQRRRIPTAKGECRGENRLRDFLKTKGHTKGSSLRGHQSAGQVRLDGRVQHPPPQGDAALSDMKNTPGFTTQFNSRVVFILTVRSGISE